MMLSNSKRAQSTAATRRRPPETYRISGETVTMAQMAERLGMTVEQLRHRWKREVQLPGAITWERLAR